MEYRPTYNYTLYIIIDIAVEYEIKYILCCVSRLRYSLRDLDITYIIISVHHLRDQE